MIEIAEEANAVLDLTNPRLTYEKKPESAAESHSGLCSDKQEVEV